jgi:DNA-binding CsgD family transcriptional regulator/sugar-specific transcriptional regulator TrmB
VDASPLGALGLGPLEEAIYRELVTRPAIDRDSMQMALTGTGVGAHEIDRALAALQGMGLTARKDGQYVATSPAVALMPLVARRRDELRRAELELAALAERYRSSAVDRPASDLVEVVTGVDAIARRFDQLQRGATTEVLALVTAETTAVSRADNTPAEDDSVRRGVTYRVVVERAVLEQAGATKDLAGAISAGEEVRMVEQVPIKLLAADRSLAMVPMTAEGGEPAAVVVHRSGLLDALLALFDAVWAKAWPLRFSELGEPTAQAPESRLGALDRQVLALLLAGLTDKAIASQLGLSMRTVQRRVQSMMEIAAVQTRMQLGWHAARAGWT